MKLVNRALRWFKLGDAETPAARALVIEQFKSLNRQFPTLYLVLIVDTISIVYALPATVPWILRFGAPCVMVILSVARLVYWLRLKTAAPSADAALVQLRRIRILVVLGNLGFSVGALALFEAVDVDLQIMVSLLVFMGAVGSAYCLGSFPSAARLTLLFSALPIALRLLASGNATLVCVGVNLCLLLVLLVRMLNTYYSGFVRLVASRARLAAERERARRAETAALGEQATTERIAARFDTALNNMSQGLCFFDGQQRLIVCNRRYIDMYDLPPESVQSGTTLQEIVALRFAAGSFPQMTREEYLAWRNDVVVADKPSDTVVHLNNGRVFEIHHQPTPDRGWVATHEDVTERYQAQEALADAKAVAERAEREARIAHARLVDALDAVPAGLALFDDHDRYVLWNRRYAEIYAHSREFLAPGLPFEQIVRAGLARGQYPEAKGREEEWLRERLALHALPHSTHEQELAGDRWLRVEERRTADGGRIGVRIDITDLKRREASFRLLFEANPLPMWVFDVESLAFLAVNDAACQHYGYRREAFLAMTIDRLRVPEERERLREEFRITKGEHGNGTMRRHVTADGTLIDVAVETRPLVYNGSNARVAAAFDMTERMRAERRIDHLARHDALTDLPNRGAFDEHFAKVLDRARATGGSFAVLCVDLDRFKEINDLFGHSVGDAVLREASRRLREAARRAFLARIGGDEFVLIAADGALPTSAQMLADRLRASFAADVLVDDRALRLDISIGIAVFPGDGRDATTLIGNADAALYRAKHHGRGTIRFFTAAMDRQLRERRALQHDLRSAIEHGELSLAYQPQSRIDGEITGFEALARWHHPTRGRVPPAEFIPVAEESGLIVEIGEWILREACREAVSWERPLQVAVNVSAVQFRRGNLQKLVHAILLETGLAPGRLELEITEGVLVENVSRAAAVLRKLKALGVRIALDDFGTGYSSLSYLQSFPLDRIKIDRAFVARLGRSDASLAIVRAVIGLAHGLSLPVLAEGVETHDQLAILSRESCDDVQGFLIGKPRPIATYADLVGGKALAGGPSRSRAGATG